MQGKTHLTGRQYGLDWLRIGAFGLLILYHIGMFFVPWGWHVKAAEPVEWAGWPMMASATSARGAVARDACGVSSGVVMVEHSGERRSAVRSHPDPASADPS